MLRIHLIILFALLQINTAIVGSNQILLPVYAHNTVGEMPILETFDDKILRNFNSNSVQIDYGLISADGAFEVGVM